MLASRVGLDERNSIDQLLGNVAYRMIAIAPGAKRSLSLRSVVERFVRVGQYLVSRGLKVVVSEGPGCADLSRGS